jgi:hypothetical protein
MLKSHGGGMVYALVSKTNESNLLRVRVPPMVPV